MGQQPSRQRVIPINNFNARAYMGTWLELARTNELYEIGCENVWAYYYDLDDKNGTFKIKNYCGGSFEREITGLASKRNLNNLYGSFSVSFSSISRIFPGIRGSYNVIFTDYENFSIVSNDEGTSVWILGRNETSKNDPLFLKFVLEMQKRTRVHPSDMIWTLSNNL